MAKSKDAGAAPVSKYAERKSRALNANKAKSETPKEVVKELDVNVADEEAQKDLVADTPKVAETPKLNKKLKEEVKEEVKQVPVVAKDVYHAEAKKPIVPPTQSKKSKLPDEASKYPDHFINLALILKQNAEIRRFTSVGIINYLYQKKIINTTKAFVSFKWNKFSVTYNHLMKEYSYDEVFFLNCLVASFSTFSAAAQRTIDTFTSIELDKHITDTVDIDEIKSIDKSTQAYINERN